MRVHFELLQVQSGLRSRVYRVSAGKLAWEIGIILVAWPAWALRSPGTLMRGARAGQGQQNLTTGTELGPGFGLEVRAISEQPAGPVHSAFWS